MARCAICYTKIETAEQQADCPHCSQVYHRECLSELGGCGTYGCAGAAQAEKPVPRVVGGGWGDMKTCPACAREIGSSLLRCGCGATFPYAEPMTAGEFATWAESRASIKSSKRWLTVLFIVTLLGVVAPVSGLIAGIFAWTQRHRLVGSDGTFLAIGYGAAAIGCSYGVIALLLVLGL